LTRSKQSAVSEVVFDDNISDSVENELHVIGIGSTRELSVNVLGFFAFVEILELVLDIRACFVVGIVSWQDEITSN